MNSSLPGRGDRRRCPAHSSVTAGCASCGSVRSRSSTSAGTGSPRRAQEGQDVVLQRRRRQRALQVGVHGRQRPVRPDDGLRLEPEQELHVPVLVGLETRRLAQLVAEAVELGGGHPQQRAPARVRATAGGAPSAGSRPARRRGRRARSRRCASSHSRRSSVNHSSMIWVTTRNAGSAGWSVTVRTRPCSCRTPTYCSYGVTSANSTIGSVGTGVDGHAAEPCSRLVDTRSGFPGRARDPGRGATCGSPGPAARRAVHAPACAVGRRSTGAPASASSPASAADSAGTAKARLGAPGVDAGAGERRPGGDAERETGDHPGQRLGQRRPGHPRLHQRRCPTPAPGRWPGRRGSRTGTRLTSESTANSSWAARAKSDRAAEEPRGQRAGQPGDAVDQPRDQAAHGVDGQRDAGERWCALLLGVTRPRRRPWRRRPRRRPGRRSADEQDRRAAQRRRPARGAVVGRRARAARSRAAADSHIAADRSRSTTPVRKPTGGSISVARKVTSGGPTTKTTSSTTDSKANAVCRRLGVERVRPAGPHHRADVRPAQRRHSPASTNHDQVGASSDDGGDERDAEDQVAGEDRSAGRTPWPRRSMARAHCGLASEPTSARVPATAPARP